MASQTDEAERRVRAQRALIQEKLANLEGRVGDDLSYARERLQHHVTHAADVVPGGPRLIEQVEQHPIVALAGGMGLGVAAGMMGNGGTSRSSPEDRGDRNGASSAGGGAATMILGSLTSNLISPLRPYLEDAAKQVISGFADRQRGTADAEGNSGSSSARDGQPRQQQGPTPAEPAAPSGPSSRS